LCDGGIYELIVNVTWFARFYFPSTNTIDWYRISKWGRSHMVFGLEV